jgi:alpha-D-xyloside xylohydrolase
VYLPEGTDWYDYTTGQRFEGGQTIKVSLALDQEGVENIPMFVRANSLIPIAEPVMFVAENTVFKISARAYGEKPEPFALCEDDGVSFNFEKGEQNRVLVGVSNGKVTVDRKGGFKGIRYKIAPMPEKLGGIGQR